MNRNALHVLWQKGTKLKRSLVDKLCFRLYDAYKLFKEQNLKLYKSKVPYLDLVANIGEGHPIDSDDDHSRVGENTEGILFYADMPGWQYLMGSRQKDPMAWFTFPPKPMPPTEPSEPYELERYKRDFPLWQERVKSMIAMCRETMARRVDEIYARHVATCKSTTSWSRHLRKPNNSSSPCINTHRALMPHSGPPHCLSTALGNGESHSELTRI